MSADAFHALMSRFQSFEDAGGGFSEEFLPDAVGGGGLAILTRPLGESRATGIVVCRSAGPEQGPLSRLETVAARELARRGFPVIRIRRGLGDEKQPPDLDLADVVNEAEGAATAIREVCGVDRVGAVGCILGGSGALIAATRLELSFAAVVNPVVLGSSYLRDLYRRQLVTGFMTPTERVARRERFEERLERGPALVRGMRLTRAAFTGLAGLDLGEQSAGFRGDVLLAAVSRSGEPDEGIAILARKLEEGGATVTVEGLADPLPAPFGEVFVRRTGDGSPADTRIGLDRSLAAFVAGWAEER
ncbi:MAG TPA: hypothetical protein VGM80_11070 [Gaiellaceae bacterium]